MFEFLNILQYPLVLLLSFYVAIYLLDNVFLNVLLNIVALEFVSDLDDYLIEVYTSWSFGEGTSVSVSLLDITYKVDESFDLWYNASNTSAKKLREELCKEDIDCSMRWKLLMLKLSGIGLLDKTDDG